MSEKLRISGKGYELPAPVAGEWERRPGGWLVLETPDGQRRRVRAHEVRGQFSFAYGGVTYAGTLQQESRGSGAAAQDADLMAQFPGKVRKILVEAGAPVEASQPLMLLEAMKMEFTVRAPAAGKVRTILVKEGQQLSPGDRLLELDPHA